MSKLFKTVLGVLSFVVAGVAAVGVFRPRHKPRQGWERRFRLMALRGDDKLIELPVSSWDEDQWVWE